ncbi:DUF2269 domain-containing protein [Streptomyces sp. NA04227]|uniref:DUF2269 domain-containing protein n=1 Tax=Streptomyces sp. NA04227 TaxID=2742136 RepID=UPI001591C60C|nr:DUF2269 domain-containing protein [Streptomyces sp. NA04227]QKW07842.1 DUF2269 domain-containing protein [Streptomyces sp. NA04227]
MKLRRPSRRAFLVLHVCASVGWLGLSLGLLALAITAAATGSPEAAEASYRSMKMFADWLLLPMAFTTLATGLVLSLGTQWGLLQHRWVSVKFWVSLIATGLTVFSLRPGINTAAAEAMAGEPVTDTVNLVVAPSVALATYVFLTAVSLLKPWGLTRRGRKQRSQARENPAARKTVDAGGLRPTA